MRDPDGVPDTHVAATYHHHHDPGLPDDVPGRIALMVATMRRGTREGEAQ